jgi:hypothetical protein
MRVPVVIALFNKAVRLGTLGHNEEAIAVYDDLLARFGNATELPLREVVAKARSLRDRLNRFRTIERESADDARDAASIRCGDGCRIFFRAVGHSASHRADVIGLE